MKINNVMTVLVVSGLAGCASILGNYNTIPLPDCQPLVMYQGNTIKLSTAAPIKIGAEWNESKLREAATQLQFLDIMRIESCKSFAIKASMGLSRETLLVHIGRYDDQIKNMSVLAMILASNDKDAPEKFQKILQLIYNEHGS